MNKIDDEIIVRFAQIISNNIAETHISEVLKPLDGYWQEAVSLMIQDYEVQHYDIDLCGVLSSAAY